MTSRSKTSALEEALLLKPPAPPRPPEPEPSWGIQESGLAVSMRTSTSCGGVPTSSVAT